MKTDKYDCFHDLAQHERADLDYRIEVVNRASSVAIVAPHGGGIEPHTSTIARFLCGVEYSLYLFEGMKAAGNSDLHITSSRFDEPQCIDLLRTVERVITIHGDRRGNVALFTGGLDEDLATRIAIAVTMLGITARPHDTLAGRNAQNICNLGTSRAGVQLEFSRGLREAMVVNYPHDSTIGLTTLGAKICEAIRAQIV